MPVARPAIICVSCGSEYASSATACPACRAPNGSTTGRGDPGTVGHTIVVAVVLSILAMAAFGVANGAAFLFHWNWPNWYLGIIEKILAVDLLIFWLYLATATYRAFATDRLPSWDGNHVDNAVREIARFYQSLARDIVGVAYFDRVGDYWPRRSYMPSRFIVRRAGGWRRVTIMLVVFVVGSYALSSFVRGLLNL